MMRKSGLILGQDAKSMANDLTSHPDFDFSQYRPGDVFCVPKREIMRAGQAETFMVLAALSKAAGRAGLLIETTFDDANDELRVLFK
jgi:uncharacterized protein (DUF2237 family)